MKLFRRKPGIAAPPQDTRPLRRFSVVVVEYSAILGGLSTTRQVIEIEARGFDDAADKVRKPLNPYLSTWSVVESVRPLGRH